MPYIIGIIASSTFTFMKNKNSNSNKKFDEILGQSNKGGNYIRISGEIQHIPFFVNACLDDQTTLIFDICPTVGKLTQ